MVDIEMGDVRFSAQNIDELLSSLPACRRCRMNKRRCDTQLPSCRNCSKAGTECIFFDHVLGEDLPRSYISSLLQCLQDVQQQRSGQNHSQGQASSHQRLYVHPDPGRRSSHSAEGKSANRATRYIGKRSCLSQTLPVIHDSNIIEQRPPPPALEIGSGASIPITREIHKYLLTTYFRDIHCLYPFLDESMPPFLSHSGNEDDDLIERAPWQHFILELVYSIACHHILDCAATDRDGCHRYRVLADECHRRALQHIDHATADMSIITLQAITLLALHSLFDPQRGNFGQLIGFAARLAIDLGSGGGTGSSTGRLDLPDQKEVRMQQIYISIYCMENQFATALARPCFLPEPTQPLQFDPNQPQSLLCSLYRIQSRFRSNPNSHDVAEFLSQHHHIGALLEQQVSNMSGLGLTLSPNVLALAYETQLLIHPDDVSTAQRLLAIYTHPRYVRTFLTPQWAYKAGVVVVLSEQQQQRKQSLSSASPSSSSPLSVSWLQQGQGSSQSTATATTPAPPTTWSWWSTPAAEAYGNCLLVLDQSSRRWSGAAALKQSIQSFVSSSSSSLSTSRFLFREEHEEQEEELEQEHGLASTAAAANGTMKTLHVHNSGHSHSQSQSQGKAIGSRF